MIEPVVVLFEILSVVLLHIEDCLVKHLLVGTILSYLLELCVDDLVESVYLLRVCLVEDLEDRLALRIVADRATRADTVCATLVLTDSSCVDLLPAPLPPHDTA